MVGALVGALVGAIVGSEVGSAQGSSVGHGPSVGQGSSVGHGPSVRASIKIYAPLTTFLCTFTGIQKTSVTLEPLTLTLPLSLYKTLCA